jgi:hypothetical protein
MRLLGMMRGRGISWGRLMFVSVFSMAIDKLNTDLLGESEFNILASRSSKLGDALLGSFCCFLNLWDSDALLSSQVFTCNSHQRDWLIDTGLDWLRVSNLNSWLNNSNYWDVVACLLGNLLAIVVSVSVSISTISMSISLWSGLTDGHHLGLAYLLKGDLNSLGSCCFNSSLIRVGADLIINFFNAFGTDSTGDWVALLFVNNFLDSKLNWAADSLESRGANFSRFNNILN